MTCLFARRRTRHRLAVPIFSVAGATVVRFHDLATVVGSEDDLAVPVLDIVDDRRRNRPAVVGQDRVGVYQPFDGRIARAQCDREITVILADAELRGIGDDLVHPGLRGGANGHQVARLLDAPAHRLGTGIFAVEIAEAFVAQPRALPNAEGCIDDDRRRRQAILQRGHIDDRLERRTRLPKRLGRTVVGGADNVEPALHRQHAAGMDLLRQETAANLGDRADGIAVRAQLLDDDDHSGAKIAERRPAAAALRLLGGRRRQALRSSHPKIRSARYPPTWTARRPSSSRRIRCRAP